MNQTWYECKIRCNKTMGNGMEKMVTEPYLVSALSHTEAEARIIEEVRPFIQGEFEVVGIRPQKVSEMFFYDSEKDDRWYKAKLAFLTIDEKNGTEKRTVATVMVQAADLHAAIAHLDEGMKQTMADYVILSVAETALLDVYPFESRG